MPSYRMFRHRPGALIERPPSRCSRIYDSAISPCRSARDRFPWITDRRTPCGCRSSVSSDLKGCDLTREISSPFCTLEKLVMEEVMLKRSLMLIALSAVALGGDAQSLWKVHQPALTPQQSGTTQL